MNFLLGMCTRPVGIIAGAVFSKSISFEFMLSGDMALFAELISCFLHWSQPPGLPYKMRSPYAELFTSSSILKAYR
jgi:hypothetical protein